MNRQTALIVALVAVLVLIAYWFLLIGPKRSELAETEDMIDTVQQEQLTLQSRLTELRDVRRRAPELEAFLAASQALVPPDAALPATVRSLQLASDASGVTLTTIAPGAPSAGQGVRTLSLSLTLRGGYFQLVDFLRRIEDPAIVSRAIEFTSITLSPTDYPTLSASLSGQMYMAPPAPPAAEEGGS